jgi:glycosyltransferase involved in cell wall biosynthesis
VGGVDVSLRTILGSIDIEKFESTVVHGHDDADQPFILKDGTTAPVFNIDIQREIHLLKDLKAIWDLRKILKSIKPDLIHAHSAKGGLIARVASLFYKTIVLHTPQAYSYLSKPTGIKRFLFLKVERILKAFNSILLASSTSEKNRGINEVHYKPTRVRLFNNAIKPVKTVGTNTFVDTLPDSYIATVGRPSFQKNIESMLKVIAQVKMSVPEVRLVIMGVGHYSPNLENVKNMITNLALEENIILVEWQDRVNILEAIAASKFYVSTARYEGLPYSVIEAMALGKALVLTNVDGNRDLVNHTHNGYLIEENEEKEMASIITSLYNNLPKIKQLGANSSAYFESDFNMNKQINFLEDIYLEYIHLKI